MFQWGIRKRLIVSYLALVIISSSLLGCYFLWFFYHHNIQVLTRSLQTQADIVQQLLAQQTITPPDRGRLDEIVKTMGARLDLRITLIAPDGVVLADSWENPSLMNNQSQQPEVKAAFNHQAGSSLRFSPTSNENMLYVATPFKQDLGPLGLVRLSASLTWLDAGFVEVRNMLLFVSLLASLLAIAFSWRLARKYTAPLEEITTLAQQIAQGKLDRRIHIRTGDELELLAHTLNQLAANLDDKVNEIVAEKSKLELIFEHTNSPIILLGPYGQVSRVNKAAVDTFSITPNMVGSHNLQVIGNSHFDKMVHATVDENKNRTIDLKTDLKGNKHAFQVSLAPITNTEGTVNAVLAVFHDITALKELQEKQAEFIANASHELATPLTAIKGFSETLLDGALADPELGIRFVGIIHTEAERMDRLVKDLLQMAKLDSQDYRKGIRLEPTPVGQLITATVNELAGKWQEKKLAITIDAPPQPLTVLANIDWLKQVFINLIDNAIKYTPSGGRIILSWYQDNEMVTILVKDTGAGIPSQDLPRIFERFYRVDRARTRSAGGTGLGLAIVKFIIELFNGQVTAKSDLDVGTTIIISLPVAEWTETDD